MYLIESGEMHSHLTAMSRQRAEGTPTPQYPQAAVRQQAPSTLPRL